MSSDVASKPQVGLQLSGRMSDPSDWSMGGTPYLTQQYALPIHNAGVGRDKSSVSRQFGEQVIPAENTLRRKTPNGTLNAGYDGSNNESNPQKYQLLPFSDNNTAHYSHNRSNSSKRTFLEHQQRQNDGPGGWNGSWGSEWPGAHLAQPQHMYPVMDSMLNQMPLASFNSHPYYGQAIPSVRQPSFQYLGPTASGVQDSGPYGPYWHDGTFVPYRPAAVRDPRFYQGHPWQHITLPHGQSSPMQGFFNQVNTASYNPAMNMPTLSHAVSPFGNMVPPLASQQVSGPLQHTPLRPQLMDDGLLNSMQNVQNEFGPSSPNGRQRDKTFAWALQQYRDLLAFIHQSRKQQQQSRLVQGQPHIAQKPRFYPKPPKPSLSGSSMPLTRRRTGSPLQLHTQNQKTETQQLSKDTSLEDDTRNSDSELEMAKLRASSLWSPSGIHFQDSEYHRRASHQQSLSSQTQWPNVQQFEDDKYRTIRRSSGSSVASISTPLPSDNSPPSRATVALSFMTQLCQDTEWRWTDGMHLGGCLAYGLGNYQQAQRWYKKVLETDSKHLEAMSNLAATLLALGQRQEAEQWWMKVVNAAPNHFEAVEHLVGMLCNDQRSRVAVRVIEHVERSLTQPKRSGLFKATTDRHSECSSSNASRSPCASEMSDKIAYEFDHEAEQHGPDWREAVGSNEPGFGSSGFAIPGCDNGRMLALIHAKGNMLYGLGDNAGAARAFEQAVLIASGRTFGDIQGLVKQILSVVTSSLQQQFHFQALRSSTSLSEPILLAPEQALNTAKLCFPYFGELPGLHYLPGGPLSIARKAGISTTSNSLLSLAKIFQDGMSNTNRAAGVTPLTSGVRDILALYYLSLSLQPSPSTANNVGILLASVQQTAVPMRISQKVDIPGVVPGSGIALALQYYNYGLQLDQHHAHLYTNLGSLLKDIGQLDAAINMYERAVKCDAKFDIALANLANAVKDKGRINDAISYYKRAVEVSPDFAEAVCGLANALNSVCAWTSRGGVTDNNGKRDRWHVDSQGMLVEAKNSDPKNSGWIKRVVEIVEKQLVEGQSWGNGTISASNQDDMVQQLLASDTSSEDFQEREISLKRKLLEWSGQSWEGARLVRLLERATRRIGWLWYQDAYVKRRPRNAIRYRRPQLPAALTVPTAPTVLPFHTFTCPMSARQIRLISQRNGLRISVSTLRAPWLPKQIYPPPRPPAPYLNVGYVSSDFNNHPLAHLMQSVFGMHNHQRVKAHCYATTASDNSIHRQQIQSEAPVFHDVSNWSAEQLVNQIVKDGIHVLVNLNGYTRGARNEVFAARPAPIQMSFMGFAGTLGAEWCDYLLADETAVPPSTVRPWRRNVDLEDQLVDENNDNESDDWVYGENIIYSRDTFFCCDHRQSAPDAQDKRLSWDEEQKRRWQMRKELFPQISDDTIIFGNFNQLYKIEPTTFRTWLRILARVPNSMLWLLRFPDLGESHLLATARLWAGAEVASRVIFTDVAPKHLHISRARICDLVLDTAECNAHTTAADVLWSGTPLLTLPRYEYKMCSRMAASILKGALPKTEEGAQVAKELIATDEDDYERKAVALGSSLRYHSGLQGISQGRLEEMRHLLFHARWSSALFDTKRWVQDLEDAYEEAWRRWVVGEGGDIWLDRIHRKAD